MKVSIIIPCHNCEQTIDRAVISVFCQTFTDWELILVNNNSNDKTWDKINAIKANNPQKTIVVIDEKKKGAPAARNRGLYEAKGEWIQFLDADDELLPKKIETQLNSAIHNNWMMVYSPFIVVKLCEDKEVIVKKTPVIKEDKWEALLRSRMGITSANFWKKSILIAVSGWNENLTSSQEYDLMFRILSYDDNVGCIDEISTKVFLQEISISNKKDVKSINRNINNYIGLRKAIFDYLKKRNINVAFYERVHNDVISNYYLHQFHNAPFTAFIRYNFSSAFSMINRLKVNYSFLSLFVNKFK